MKLTFDGFEVEIKAKRGGSRANKKDTMDMLNRISIWASMASKMYESQGYPANAEAAEKAADEIFYALKAAGCYSQS